MAMLSKRLDDFRRYLLLPIFTLNMYVRDGSHCVGLLARLDVPELPSGYVTVFERCFDRFELASEYMAQVETIARNVLGNLVVKKHFGYAGE
jgi:hypothetical protein